jgi:hypothetical protein
VFRSSQSMTHIMNDAQLAFVAFGGATMIFTAGHLYRNLDILQCSTRSKDSGFEIGRRGRKIRASSEERRRYQPPTLYPQHLTKSPHLQLRSPRPLRGKTSVSSVRVFSSSTTFFETCMLDMHKASADQLNIDLRPAYCLMKDILQPVSAILHQREQPYSVEVDFLDDLTALTDRMRLK